MITQNHRKVIENKLNQHDLEDLEKSGLTSPIPDNYQSVSSEEAYKATGHKLAGLLIEYCDPSRQPYRAAKKGTKWERNFCRIKPDWDAADEKTREFYSAKSGKLPKYLSPSGAGVRPYFSLYQEWGNILRSTFNAIDLTEGEKKADKACLDGFPTIGLSGVTCHKDHRQETNYDMGSSWDTDEPEKEDQPQSKFLPELEEINWKYRPVGLCFDSDLLTKKPVQFALVDLFKQLKGRGAMPFPILLPSELDGSKNGLDDFLSRHGKEAYELLRISCKRLQQSPHALIQFNKVAKTFYIEDVEPNALLKGILLWSVLKENWAYRKGLGWYRWIGTHWEFSSEDELMVEIVQFQDANAWLERSCNQLKFLVTDLKNRVLVPENKWNAAKKIAFGNGTLDVETNKFYLSKREDYLTSCLDYDYNELAKCPTWEQFMLDAMGGDQELIQLLRSWMKWILYPKRKDDKSELEKILDLMGRKGTGKGTFLDILIKLIGEGNYGIASPQVFSTPQGLAQLVDKKLAIDTDSSGFLKAIGEFNKVVTNEPVSVKKLYKDEAPVRLGVVIVRAYNDFVKVPSSGSEGLDRRLCIVPFNHTPKSVDTQLSSKLRGELTGIFQWAWSIDIDEAKLRILNAGNFKEVAQMCKERFLDTHPEFIWLEDKYQLGADSEKAEDCYQSYKEWADKNGLKPLSLKSLKSFLDTLGVLKTLPRIASGVYYQISAMKDFNLEKYLKISVDEPQTITNEPITQDEPQTVNEPVEITNEPINQDEPQTIEIAVNRIYKATYVNPITNKKSKKVFKIARISDSGTIWIDDYLFIDKKLTRIIDGLTLTSDYFSIEPLNNEQRIKFDIALTEFNRRKNK